MNIGLGIPRHIGALLIRRPLLLWEAMQTFWTMRRHGRPYRSRAYLGWRVQTAYGDANAPISPNDLVDYLEWRKQMRRIRDWKPLR